MTALAGTVIHPPFTSSSTARRVHEKQIYYKHPHLWLGPTPAEIRAGTPLTTPGVGSGLC